MKHFLTYLLTLGVLLSLAAPVRADILWEPYDDSFFEEHRSELEHVNRYFLANGKDGFVTLWDMPGGSGVVAQYENCEKLRVYDVYQDWGLITVWEDGVTAYGWTPLEDLSLVYDHISFAEEYAGQIRDYNGEFAGYDGELNLINYYEYPGAPEVKEAHELSSLYRQEIKDRLTGAVKEGSCISRIFTDESGLTWGYVNYLFGPVNGWFCLDSPDGTDFPVRQVPEVEFTAPQTPKAPMVSYLPYILVGGVVTVTAGLLYWFYARKRSKKFDAA